MGEYWCQVQFGSHSNHTVRLRAVYNLASSRLRESRARWIEKARTENKTGGNWGEEGLLYPFSNLFPFPAPSTFRVPFTFGISPLSESLEQIQTRGWGEVLNLVWERSFFPKPTDNFDRFSYFVRCKYRYISSIKNVFILFLSSPIPAPSQNSAFIFYGKWVPARLGVPVVPVEVGKIWLNLFFLFRSLGSQCRGTAR